MPESSENGHVANGVRPASSTSSTEDTNLQAIKEPRVDLQAIKGPRVVSRGAFVEKSSLPRQTPWNGWKSFGLPSGRPALGLPKYPKPSRGSERPGAFAQDNRTAASKPESQERACGAAPVHVWPSPLAFPPGQSATPCPPAPSAQQVCNGVLGGGVIESAAAPSANPRSWRGEPSNRTSQRHTGKDVQTKVPAASLGLQKSVAVKKLSCQGLSRKLLASKLALEQKHSMVCREASARSKDTCSNLAQAEDRAVFRLLEEIARVVHQSCRAPQQIVPAVSHLADDFNNLRQGKTFEQRAAILFASALDRLMVQEEVLANQLVREGPSMMDIFQVFAQGREAVTHHHIGVSGNRWYSFDQIGKLSQQQHDDLRAEYLAATKALLYSGDGSERQSEISHADHALILRYTKESAVLLMVHLLSNPSSMQMIAERQAASVPRQTLEDIVEAGAFTDSQIEEIWGCWFETVGVMLHLKPSEDHLRAQMQLAVKQCLEGPHRLENYSYLLCTAAEFKRNLEAQAKMIFSMTVRSSMTFSDPIQVARMSVAADGYPLFFHLLFLSGIFPKAKHGVVPPQSTP